MTDTVQVDREALADVLSGIGWDGSNGAPRGYYLDRADALIASGVLGVSADLIRAEARWKALGEAADALAAYRDKRRSTLSISHATDALRVVSALHAEASAEHLRLGMGVADHG